MEDALGAEDEAAIASDVVGLYVYFLAVALNIQQRHVWLAQFICPDGHEAIAHAAVLEHLIVGAEVEMIGEGFGLHGGEVDHSIRELSLMVLFAGTWESGHKAAFGQSIESFTDDFADAEAVMFEADCVSAAENPRLEFVVTVYDSCSPLDLEELRMESAAKECQVVRL